MGDIEQQCEDAVFEVCDARERYPALCANELARSIRIESEISVAPVKPRIPEKLEPACLTEEQQIFFETIGIESEDGALSNEQSAKKWKNLFSKMNDLKIIAEQISAEKYCKMNELLEKK